MAKQKKKPKDKNIVTVDEQERSSQEKVNYIIECRKEADEASKGRRIAWRELWNLYQNKQDYSKKQTWQSRAFAPKIFMQVERSAGLIKRALIQTRKLFKFELADDDEQAMLAELRSQLSETTDPPIIEEVRQQIDVVKKGLERRSLKMARDEKTFKHKLEKTNLTNIYSEMTKGAFLLGMGWPKVLWDAEESNLTFENTDALNVSVSPEYQPFQKKPPKYLIECQRMDLAELRELAENVNKEAGSNIYDMVEVDKIEEDFKEEERQLRERTRRGLAQFKVVGKKVELLQFWGNIVAKDDKSIKRDQLCIVANKKYLIREQDNPFNHKRPPHIPTMPIAYPHRGIAGISLVEPMAKLQYTFNNIMNMFVDNLNFSVNKMFQYNPNNLQNPKMLTAMFPGKMIPMTADALAVTEIPVTPVGKDALAALELIDRQMQEGTAVTEFVQGLPGTKAKTLGEVELKTAEGQSLFDIIARDLEENSLKVLLEMAYDISVQFGNDDLLPREGNYLFRAGGISLLLNQRVQTERLQQILGMSLQSPDLAQMTDIADLWKKFLGLYNLSDSFKEPAEMVEAQLNPEQQQSIQAKAEQEAKRDVANMPPEQVMRLTGS